MFAATHSKLKNEADGTGVQVATCIINKWMTKINEKEVYNIRGPPRTAERKREKKGGREGGEKGKRKEEERREMKERRSQLLPPPKASVTKHQRAKKKKNQSLDQARG